MLTTSEKLYLSSLKSYSARSDLWDRNLKKNPYNFLEQGFSIFYAWYEAVMFPSLVNNTDVKLMIHYLRGYIHSSMVIEVIKISIRGS